VLRWGLVGVLGGALPAGAALAASRRTPTSARATGEVEPASQVPAGLFTRPLPIPQVLTPVSTGGGVDRYEIRQTQAQQRILSDVSTPVWGYNGTFPGPTIVARRGRPVIVTHHNELSVPTVAHLHGGLVAADHDGYPLDLLLPASGTIDPEWAEHAKHGVAGAATGSRAHHYPNDQPAATLWYHDHRMGFTGPQVYRGLAGFYLLHDDTEDALPLPRDARDVPLMIADRIIKPDGTLFYPASDPTGRNPGVTVQYHHSGLLGETITVNGTAWPYLEVDAALYRLRFLNASNARVYTLILDPPPPGGNAFVQIGSDAGLLPKPVHYDQFVLSSGERYDMLIDFSRYPPGTRVYLKNTLESDKLGFIMRFDVTRRVHDDARIPDALTTDPGPPPQLPPGRTSDRKFSFFIGPPGVFGPPMVNGATFNPLRIDARPAAGATEIWDITADPTHPIHLHGGHFRIVTRDGQPPQPQDGGWKDTVFVPNGGMRLAVTLGANRGKFVYHCHNLEHGDAGMMANLDYT
jgi:FtsP/CotA-like multicopper oxidase with cupredoxin domain